MIATMGVNSIFALPFIQSLYGAEGIARYIAYDAVNTILLYSWAYSIAVKANPAHVGAENVLVRRLLKSPPLYAVVAGLVVNALDLHMPAFVTTTATSFGAPTAFLVTLAVGISVDPRRENIGVSLLTMALRTTSAVVVGVLFILIFDLQGIDRVAVILFCVAPLAFSSATFAALENLDVRFASEMLSLSLVVGIVVSMLCAIAFV